MTGRTFITLGSAFVASAMFASSASAQVFVRAPFVRVETGGPGGTYVRAPFVNLYVPAGPPPIVYGPPPGFYPPQPFPPGQPLPGQPFPVAPQPSVSQLPPARTVPQPLPAGPTDPKQAEPPLNPDFAPPAPAQAPKAPTIEQFAKSFKAKAGNYEVTLVNPVTGQPETVKFSLPGDPREVRTERNGIQFVYGLRRFVRIEFDQDGPIVITR